MARKGGITPTGTGDHCWLTQADTKYNKDGVWKTGLILGGEDAQKLKDQVDEAIEDIWAEELEKLAKNQRKTCVKYFPYQIDEDDSGNPTGHIRFAFKQNKKIKLTEPDPITGKDYKIITIPIRDAKNQLLKRGAVSIWSGSKIKIAWKPRAVVLKSNDPAKIGVQLNIQSIQLIELKTGTGPTFDEVKGGYVADASQYAGADDDVVEDNEAEAADKPAIAPAAQSEY